jgi:hypothetical protein
MMNPKNSIKAIVAASWFVAALLGGFCILNLTYSSGVVAQVLTLKETGIIFPGDEYRFANGVVIRSMDALLDSSVEVTVEKISPQEVAEPISNEYETVGPFYRIIVAENPSQTSNFDLEFGFPVPIPFRGEDIFQLSLVPKNLITDGDDSEGFIWHSGATPRVERDHLFFSQFMVRGTGRIYTLVVRKP